MNGNYLAPAYLWDFPSCPLNTGLLQRKYGKKSRFERSRTILPFNAGCHRMYLNLPHLPRVFIPVLHASKVYKAFLNIFNAFRAVLLINSRP